MFQTPFPAFLKNFSRKFGPPLLVVATAGLIGALKAPPKPPITPAATPLHATTAPPRFESPSTVKTIGDPLIFVHKPRFQMFLGNYTARYYGLKMRIPDGLIGFDDGASHHGFQIPLLQTEEETLDQRHEHLVGWKQPLIGLSFYYNAPMTSFERERDENNWGSTIILKRKRVRIAGMNGDRTLFSKPDAESGEKWVIDQIILGRHWLDGDWRDENGQPVPDTFYFFYLRTTEKRYNQDVQTFEKILKTWRTFDE